MKQVSAPEAIICIIASQVANVGESIIGAALQEKEGFQWVCNSYPNNSAKLFESYYLNIVWSVCSRNFLGFIGLQMLGYGIGK